ncbi:MAG: aspartate/glutamate racemase family protein, partial [Pseudomonadota bacterium]
VILNDELEMDVEAARADLISAARGFQDAYPDLGAIILECTNMGPYQRDVSAAIGLPVFSVYDFVCWFQGSLSPRRFGAE